MLFTSTVDQLRAAEHKLFTKAFSWWRSWQQHNGLEQPAKPTTFEPSTVTTGADEYVHMVTATAAGADPKKTPMVCLHGFAHGTSVFAMTLAPLAEAWRGPVHALDSPGCGLSHRPAHQHQADRDVEKRKKVAMRVGQARFEMHADAVISDPLLFPRRKIAQKDQNEPIEHEEGKE